MSCEWYPDDEDFFNCRASRPGKFREWCPGCKTDELYGLSSVITVAHEMLLTNSVVEARQVLELARHVSRIGVGDEQAEAEDSEA